jgi:2-hydroxy-3-keto-5-methylthiopentenyl-1-phosphate phosphatase
MGRFAGLADAADQTLKQFEGEIQKAGQVREAISKNDGMIQKIDEAMEEIGRKQPLVEQIEKKVNELSSMVLNLDVKMENQLQRKALIEKLDKKFEGLDFYIEALLEKEGCGSVPVHAVNTRFDAQGINYEYRYAVPGKEELGNSKGVVVDSYRSQGHYIVYVGDGMSDFEAAARADLVFAHRVLADECERKEIPFRPFTDFSGVLQAVKELTGGLARNGVGPLTEHSDVEEAR